MTFTWLTTLESEDVLVQLEFSYYPATRDSYWGPGQPAEIEIEKAIIDGRDQLSELTDRQLEYLGTRTMEFFDEWYDHDPEDN